MLKNISPLISPSLLKILAEMGHGDEIVFSDAHFPGHTFNHTVLRADGLNADALLGAAGLPDIGFWFPPGDPACKDISSLDIVAKAVSLIRERGGRVVNVDSSLIAEAPRISPYLEQMKNALGSALGISAARVGVKATTNEQLGALGRREGIAAFAVASILMPEEEPQP